MSDSSSPSSSDYDEETFLEWFFNLSISRYFCEIDRSYIEDTFNLYGLRAVVRNYDEAMDIILDYQNDSTYYPDAIKLYGLIHARYIITARGLDAMMNKYKSGHFGKCPRALCDDENVVPAGKSDVTREYGIMTFCPKCQELYNVSDTPTSPEAMSAYSGVYFGTTFPHLFFLVYKELEPPTSTEFYIPRVFGYKVHGKKSKGFLQIETRNENESLEATTTIKSSDRSKSTEDGNNDVESNEVNEKTSESNEGRSKKRKAT